MKNIVSQEWLITNMNREDLIIFDVRESSDKTSPDFLEYKKNHIKGAHFISLEDALADKPGVHGGRHPLPNINRFAEHMKSLGVNNDSIIVIYDDGSLAKAGRLWWMLKYIGKKDIFILEGGLNHWIQNNLELTDKIITPTPSNDLDVNIDNSIKVEMEHVKSATNSDNIAIVDSRSPERYAGEVEPLDKIAGHIPNALNYPWTNLVKDGNIMSIQKLKDYFESLNKYNEIIVHCGSGITGTVNFLFMEEIGLKPKLYVGSYSDWISYDDNIIIKNK